MPAQYMNVLLFLHLVLSSFTHLHPHPSLIMLSKQSVPATLAFAVAAFAAPAPQASYFSAPAGSPSPAPIPAPSDVAVHNVTSHGPFTGVPTTTGALSTTVLAASIAPLPPNPTATVYPSDGKLHFPEPAPYTPNGGLGTNGTEPVYKPQSDFDYESLVCCHRAVCLGTRY